MSGENPAGPEVRREAAAQVAGSAKSEALLEGKAVFVQRLVHQTPQPEPGVIDGPLQVGDVGHPDRSIADADLDRLDRVVDLGYQLDDARPGHESLQQWR